MGRECSNSKESAFSGLNKIFTFEHNEVPTILLHLYVSLLGKLF
jgi:hypothetical protein